MEQRLALYEDGHPAGVLTWERQGLHRLFTAQCAQGEGVRKIWLRNSEGALLLGTLAPEQGQWRLRRQVAESELRRRGLLDGTWGEVHSGGWMPEERERPPVTFRDPVIAQAVRRCGGGKWRRAGELWRLSYPWQVGQPVPVETLFCFARTENGEIVYLLDSAGFPKKGE